MGADNSKGKKFQEAAKFGQLFIQTDKSTYFGGETVTGKIYLNLLLPYPGNQLSLKLKGKEFAAFVRTKEEPINAGGANNGQAPKTRNIDELFKEQSDVVKMIVPLYTWATLLPGQYVIPFAFMLPPVLPNSFYQEGNRYHAEISYRLEAILLPGDKKDPKLKYKQPFVVRSPVSNAAQNVENEIRTEIKTCGCISKGANVLKVNFEKNYYAPGETAQVIMQLDNTFCSAPNTTIVFNLMQSLKMAANGRSEHKEFVKVQRNLDGVQAGMKSNSNLIAVNLPQFQGGAGEGGNKAKMAHLTNYLLGLQDNHGSLNSATKGRLIISEYYLQVSCPMDGCCAASPSLRCPIEIYYPEIQLFVPQTPADWTPQEVGVVNLSFAEAPLRLFDSSINFATNDNSNANKAKDMLVTGWKNYGGMVTTKAMGFIKGDSGQKGGSGSKQSDSLFSGGGGNSGFNYQTKTTTTKSSSHTSGGHTESHTESTNTHYDLETGEETTHSSTTTNNGGLNMNVTTQSSHSQSGNSSQKSGGDGGFFGNLGLGNLAGIVTSGVQKGLLGNGK